MVNASNSAWVWNRNIPRYNIQIEINDTNTTFESYDGSIIPITFPNFSTNLFDSSNEILTAFINSNGIYSNDSTDTRTTAQLSI